MFGVLFQYALCNLFGKSDNCLFEGIEGSSLNMKMFFLHPV